MESVVFLFIIILIVFGGAYYVERKGNHRLNSGVKKNKMITYYGAGIFVEISGIGGCLYYAPVFGYGATLIFAAPAITAGIILLIYAERLRRNLKKK